MDRRDGRLCYVLLWMKLVRFQKIYPARFVGRANVEVLFVLSVQTLHCKQQLKSRLLRKFGIWAFCPIGNVHLCSLLSNWPNLYL